MSGKINAINQADVHRITSGQVIIDLVAAVKEVVENSLDAHADKLEITFRNYGLEAIECADNGDGIPDSNFDSLALKHHTSKIEEFEDLTRVTTFGFRGEALASICAMASLTVITTQKGPKAHKLEYDSHGRLVKKTVTSRNKGTTVQLRHLFNNMPVRKKEFVRNFKKQFGKCVTLLQSYALLSENCRLSIFNVNAAGSKSLLLSTPGRNDISKNILTVFGSDGMHGLQKVGLHLDLNEYKEKMLKKYSEDSTLDDADHRIAVTGYISRASFGCGRSGKDRQFIYINKRPVDYPQVLKCCNDIYRSFNNVQYPVIILNFELSPQFVDVNVTPDKRTVLLHNEEYVLQSLAEKLDGHFNEQELMLPKSLPSLPVPHQDSELKVKRRKLVPSQELIGTFEDDHLHNTTTCSEITACSQPMEEESSVIVAIDDIDECDTSSAQVLDPSVEPPTEIEPATPAEILPQPDVPVPAKPAAKTTGRTTRSTQRTLNAYLHKSPEPMAYSQSQEPSKEPVLISIGSKTLEETAQLENNKLLFVQDPTNEDPSSPKRETYLTTRDMHARRDVGTEDELEPGNRTYAEESQEDISDRAAPLEFMSDKKSRPCNSCSAENEDSTFGGTAPPESQRTQSVPDRKPLVGNALPETQCLVTCINANLEKIVETMQVISEQDRSSNHTTSYSRNEDFEDAINAENYLTLTVSKRDFKEMSIIGQFNLGFIIVARRAENKHDLFIVDQHASDEKYNFENLQKSTVFNSQHLIKPLTVELSVIDELLVLENLPLFKKNGFKIRVNEAQKQGSRIELTGMPTSKQTIFDIEDFYELLSLLKECDGVNKNSIACSKIRSMFAMRACRMSIMIGKPLTRRTMTEVVRKLSELDKPWNCPHGRPTMRHLMELKDWKSFQDDYDF
ncbi:FAER421Wp [Eremothecium gossypii FDAG1]|nr:FAER421Wp [Eremothecium gossypii FDAG1]